MKNNHDLSFLLVVSGSIETNPGPGIDKEDLDAAITTLRASMTEEFQKKQDKQTETIL